MKTSSRFFAPTERSIEIAREVINKVGEEPADEGPDALGGIGMTFDNGTAHVSVGIRNHYETVTVICGESARTLFPDDAVAIIKELLGTP